MLTDATGEGLACHGVPYLANMFNCRYQAGPNDMMTTKQHAFILGLTLLLPVPLAAQYWGERVLEKSFEQTQVFFTPDYLNPYGIGSFKSTTPGLLSDPLLDFAVNPALLALDSTQSAYLYTDFRSARNVQEKETGYYPPWIYAADNVRADRAYYPRLYVNTRRELEPVFSGAIIVRPVPSLVRDLYIGATYQMVMQDEKYYSIPQDIYRSVAGYDYNGREAAGAADIPIVDKYSGKDNMHQAGHLATAFVKFGLPAGFDISARLSRVIFSRAGSYGSSNLWEYSPYATGTSLWSNLEARNQEYAHWDGSAGIEFHVNENVALGATGGYLSGEATQALTKNDSSFYASSSTSYTSYYNRSANSLQEWRHDGTTTYYGADLRVRFSPATLLTLYYQHRRAEIDIGLGSNVLDTSVSNYTWEGTPPGTSYSQSYLSDVRSGTGTQTITTNRIAATLQWNINERVNLSVGAFVESQDQTITTGEAVVVQSRSRYWHGDASYDYRYSQQEAKELLWTFTTKRTSFQIPVFLTVKATEALEVLFGLNRNAAWWKIDDVTLALFQYRRSMYNGQVQNATNFGERYTEPREEVSDVRTTFLGGVTVTPVQPLKLRLLMVPNFHDTFDGSELEQLQWWVTLTVTP